MDELYESHALFHGISMLMTPSFSLATNRMVQNGSTPASSAKYADTSPMLNHIPYSGGSVARAIMSWKMKPVATLSILAVNMMKPEY